MGKIQHKLVQMLLITSTLPLIILAVIAAAFLNKMAVNDMNERLKSGLNASLSTYDSVCNDLKYIVRDQNRRIRTLIDEEQIDLLRNEYGKIVKENNLDFFIVTDKRGKVIVSMGNRGLEGYSLARDPYVQKALFKWKFTVSTEIFSAEELEKYGLLNKAKISGIKDTTGLVIKAVFPVITQNEIVVGSMIAGYLLNNNNKIIAEPIKKNTGLISSIFMGNVRVCSSISPGDNEYAIGSRLDPAKAKYVLEEGKDYISRILILKTWYLSAYTPIFNADKKVIGILGMGVPENSVFWLRNSLTKMFIAAVFFSIILALIFGFYRGGSIVWAVKKLRSGIEAVIKGDYEHRIQISSKDEIEELSNFFNNMIFRLQAATKELVKTERQLVQYEKMAAIGRMAAVLSHELRNIFAGIEVSMYYLKNKVTQKFPELSGITADVEKEISYANNLMANISMFGRTRKLVLGPIDINVIIKDTINSFSVQDMIKNNKVIVDERLFTGLPLIKADGVQLKEVIFNLVINAIQSMPGGGRLTLVTKKEENNLRIEVVDTGSGIPKENMNHLFTPFFTTKSNGLGVGLFVCKEVVELHHGRIEIDTELNKGSTFIVILPNDKK